MRTHSFLQALIYATLTSIALAGMGSTVEAQDLPSYMAPISGRTVSSPAETATKNVLALNTAMFELYDNAAKIFEKNISEQASRHSRPVLGRGRQVHSLSARHGAARGAIGADRLSVAQIRRP
jgi:hypothetical protein